MATDRLLVLWFAALSLFPATSRAESWTAPPFSLEPQALLAATAGPPAEDDAEVEVVLEDQRFDLDEQGRKTYTRWLVFKVLTPEGAEDWAQLQQDYLPWYQETPRFEARVVTPDGVVRTLDPKTIADSPAAQSADLLDDERILRAPLPAVTVGAVVEVRVVVADRRPFFEQGTVTRIGLDRGEPVRLSRVTIEAPRALPLRHRLEGLPGVSARLEGTGQRQTIRVEARDLPGDWPWWFPFLPPEADWGPAVTFSTGESWADIARAYSQIVDQQIAEPDFGGFDQLATKPASQQEEIRLLLERVHRDVRYTGVELGDAGLVPRSPKDTVGRRFGDCKDKAALVVALLRDRGIPAYLALLNAGTGQDVAAPLPGIGAFNHAIVYVPGSPALWIDATDPLSRLGQLPAVDQGRLALVASPTTRDLVRTPVASADDNRTVEVREMTLPLFGTGRLTETGELHGEPARLLRSAWLDKTSDEIRESLENYVEQNYKTEKLLSHEVTDSRDLSRPMTTRLEGGEVGYAVSDPDEAVAIVLLGPLFDGLPKPLLTADEDEEEAADEAKPRTADWALPLRFRREWNYRISVPSNLALRELPKSDSQSLGPGVLTREYRQEPGLVVARFEFKIDRDRLTPAEAETLRTELQEVQNVILWFDQKIAMALQAGRLGDALAEAGRLEKEYPDQAFPSIQRSRALLAAGFGEEAQKAARRATEIEPTSGAAFHQLGWALQHDVLARRLEFGGYDRAGAIQALEKAIELEPENAVYLAELAIQLEYDERGNRYATGPEDLARAATLYEKISDELDNQNLGTNLLITLARSGRWQDMLARAEQMPASDTVSTWRVAAKATLEGADAAILEAGRKFSDAGERAKALANAGELLIRDRRYPDVAKLFAAASRLGSNSEDLLGRSQIFARAKASDWGRMERPKVAEDAFWLAFALVFTPKLDLDRFFEFVTPSFRTRPIRDKDREELATVHDQLLRTSEAQGIPVEVMADIVRVMAQPRVEPTTGGEVKVAAELGDEDLTIFAIPSSERGGFDILPGDLSSLAFEARWRAENGQLEAARRYLDEALEFVPPNHPKDPLSGSPFALVWSKGQEADVDAARLAGAVGAVLTDDSEPDERDIEALDDLRALAQSPDEKLAVAWALARARMRNRLAAEAVDDAAQLLAAHPDSEAGLLLAIDAYGLAGRLDDMVALGQARLDRKPEDAWGLRFLARARAVGGRYSEALGFLDRIRATGKSLPQDLNLIAWLSVFVNTVDDVALEQAQNAVTKKQSRATLHTLATVYASLDRPNEAYTTLKQVVEAGEHKRIETDDWYVLGRMAETYGLSSLAKELYGRIPEPGKGEGQLSAWHLARLRLAKLP